jgi:hypothetical protein
MTDLGRGLIKHVIVNYISYHQHVVVTYSRISLVWEVTRQVYRDQNPLLSSLFENNKMYLSKQIIQNH